MRISEMKVLLGKIEEEIKKLQEEKKLTPLEKNILIDDVNHLWNGVSSWRKKVIELVQSL